MSRNSNRKKRKKNVDSWKVAIIPSIIYNITWNVFILQTSRSFLIRSKIADILTYSLETKFAMLITLACPVGLTSIANPQLRDSAIGVTNKCNPINARRFHKPDEP